jgi:hypothetical protein
MEAHVTGDGWKRVHARRDELIDGWFRDHPQIVERAIAEEWLLLLKHQIEEIAFSAAQFETLGRYPNEALRMAFRRLRRPEVWL